MASELALQAAAHRVLKGPLESIVQAAEVIEAPPDNVQDPPESNRVQATVASRRYLCVLRNVQSGIEEAAIIIFRRPQSPILTRVIPIFEDFHLSISQKKGNHSPTSARERSRFQITFALSPDSPTSFSLVTESISPFSSLVAEIKRLAALAKLHHFSPASGLTHRWLEHYPEDPLRSAPSPTKTIGELDPQALARFNSISTAYSVRMASLKVATPSGLRTGLSTIDWGAGERDPSTLQTPAEGVANVERGRWIVQQLQQRESAFTQKEEISVFVGTFNVNDQLPSGDIAPWLSGSEDAELLVFGFQEFDLTTEAMVRYTPYREDTWRAAIEKGLGARAELYEKLHSRQLVGALILIYVLKTEAPHITSLTSNSIATGILGLVANKGAVAIRLRYKDSWLTFVNSHLAAHANMTDRRNQEVKDIGRLLGFPYEDPVKGRDPWTPNLKPEAERPLNSLGIFDSHQLIWLGDLNYRVELPRPDVMRGVEKCEWDLLLRFDQLKIQKQHGLAWGDFEEAPITFGPTFKFDPGTSVHDTSEKQRTPSWCDRILWLAVHDGAIRSLNYTSHPEITISDHKPVSSLLRLRILTIIPEKRLVVTQEVMEKLDSYDNDHLPDLKILPSPAIQFDTVEYLKPDEKVIEVKNVGRVIAQWSFVLKPGATTICAPWLQISPTSGLILPGETSLVHLTLSIDSHTAPDLNFSTDPDALSDLLVLSIEKKDLFLSIATREYLSTCFANTLQRLSKLGKPIRTASPAELEGIRDEKPGAEVAEKVSVPKEIFRILGFLAEYAVELEDVFLAPGQRELVALIRECLDTGSEFPLDRLLPQGGVSLGGSSTTLFDLDTDDDSEHSHPHPTNLEILAEPDSSDIGVSPLSPTRTRTPGPPPPPITIPNGYPAPASSSRSRSASSSRSTDSSDDLDGVHSMADCFILFLESLPEPVVPFAAYPRALRADLRADAYRVVDLLPVVNANTLLYIVAFLRVLISRTVAENRAARTDRLAVVFSSVLMRGDPAATPDNLPPASIPRRRKAFVLHLLSAEEVDPSELGREPFKDGGWRGTPE